MFILGQLLHLLCLSAIGNPEQALLVCDLILVGIHELYWWVWSWDLVLMLVLMKRIREDSLPIFWQRADLWRAHLIPWLDCRRCCLPKLGLLPNSGKFEFGSFLQAFNLLLLTCQTAGWYQGVERIVVSSVRSWQSQAGVCKRFRRHLCRLDYLTGTINEDHRMLLDDAAWIGATRRTSPCVTAVRNMGATPRLISYVIEEWGADSLPQAREERTCMPSQTQTRNLLSKYIELPSMLVGPLRIALIKQLWRHVVFTSAL